MGYQLGKQKIYYHLDESPYIFKRGQFEIYFSSNALFKKYEREIEDYIYIQNIKLNNIYNINFNMEKFLIISFYKKIETRGFLIKYKNKKINNYNDFKFMLSLIMKK